MKIGIYGKPEILALNAFAEGVVAAGHRPIWRNPAPFTPDQIESFGAVVLLGMQGKAPNILKAYQAQKVPVIVIDFGYINRATDYSKDGFFQVGLNGLNWIPPVGCPADRFEALGIEIPATKKRATKAAHVLVCGQKPDDAQHGMTTDEILSWAVETAATLRQTTDRKILWRSHPAAPLPPVEIEGIDKVCDPSESFGGDLKGACAMVTVNSTAAYESILSGVPVFCDPSAAYAEIANTDLSAIENPEYSPEKIAAFFQRLAYGQWAIEEMATGDSVNFLLSQIQTGG